jgi:hypothetical protein
MHDTTQEHINRISRNLMPQSGTKICLHIPIIFILNNNKTHFISRPTHVSVIQRYRGGKFPSHSQRSNYGKHFVVCMYFLTCYMSCIYDYAIRIQSIHSENISAASTIPSSSFCQSSFYKKNTNGKLQYYDFTFH